jgi:chemotaxis protein methyltransferase CheR
MIRITPEEIALLSNYIYGITGIDLDQKKAYLFESRLGPLAGEHGYSSYTELWSEAKRNSVLEKKIIDAITTKETLFFRDSAPFELLQHKILPELIDRRTAKSSRLLPVPIRIWSAACSTGQEVFSIAIVLKELLPDMTEYNIKLLGTDISDSAIAQASYGQYHQCEIERGLPREKLKKYFDPHGGNCWKIKDEIRAMATFKKLNLMRPFNGLGKFDIVFCRNVAIYFCPEDRKRLFKNILDVLEKDGYLFVGSAESLTGICPLLEPKRHLRSIFYQLKA